MLFLPNLISCKFKWRWF